MLASRYLIEKLAAMTAASQFRKRAVASPDRHLMPHDGAPGFMGPPVSAMPGGPAVPEVNPHPPHYGPGYRPGLNQVIGQMGNTPSSEEPWVHGRGTGFANAPAGAEMSSGDFNAGVNDSEGVIRNRSLTPQQRFHAYLDQQGRFAPSSRNLPIEHAADDFQGLPRRPPPPRTFLDRVLPQSPIITGLGGAALGGGAGALVGGSGGRLRGGVRGAAMGGLGGLGMHYGGQLGEHYIGGAGGRLAGQLGGAAAGGAAGYGLGGLAGRFLPGEDDDEEDAQGRPRRKRASFIEQLAGRTARAQLRALQRR